MVVVETVLLGILQALVRSLMTPLFEEFFKGRGQKENIPWRLKTTLFKISAVLIDAEEKQIRNAAVQSWVNELKDAFYKAEDALDDITTKDSRRKESTNLFDIVPSVPSFSKSKLEMVTERLEYLSSQINSLNLKADTTRTHISRSMTTSKIGTQELIGRQTEKEDIMRFLMADNEDNNKISVVAIVGIGGVGKTSLAQLLYNDQRFENHSTSKAWIHVSENIDVLSITKKVYESVTSKPHGFTDLNLLQDKLAKRLGNKKILLVLDDMWNEIFEDWNLLFKPFASAAKGSCIIVTTRNHDVAKTVHASHTHTLQPLSPGDCWRVFIKQAHDEDGLDRAFGILAEQVLDKCKGLPLAANAFGSLLWSNREVDYWRTTLNSKIWTPPIDSTNILPVLQVSYHYLLSHLKQCFAYCSIFPKGYAFDRKRVVLLWMAEGLLQQAESIERGMERVGDGYFSELVSRSLFQDSDTTKFTMHDLNNELAQFAAGEFCFKYENPIQGMSGKTRHLSYLRDQYSGEAMKFEELGGVKDLRTFLPLSLRDSSQKSCLHKMVRDKLLPKLNCLRVLSLSHYNIPTLPPDIFKGMRLVRYLDLSGTNLERLPTSVCYLYNLQTLLLSYCPNLTQLDEAICTLIRLEHLYLTSTKLRHMPQSFGKLTRLQTLTTFVVGADKGATISVLRDLIELRGKLTILELHRVWDIKDAEKANLATKTHLKEIDLTWRTSAPVMDYISSMSNEDAIFEKLRPHNEIEELTIKKYYGDSFPAWMSDPSFSSIVCLTLIECQKCTSLPSLGRLPRLKELHISKMRDLRRIGPEFYSSHPESRDQDQQPFRSLQILSFEDIPNWEEWVNVEVYGGTLFPNLQGLFIVRCPKLTGDLPGRFPSLISLHPSERLASQIDTTKYPKLQR